MGLKEFKELDYYEMLGIERTATEDEVRDRYKEIAKVYHPDSKFFSDIVDTTISPDDLEIFKLVTCAYNTLINKQRREQYDREHPQTSIHYSDSIIPSHIKGWDSQHEPLVFVKARTTHSNVTWGVNQRKDVNDIPDVQSVSDVMNQGVRRVWLGALGVLCGILLVAIGIYLLFNIFTGKAH